jgi:carbonic anhydrase
MSTEQLDALRSVHDDNARPVQPLNDREVALRTP